ncbi:MAG: lysine N(6)-hydroxylase/L-ornithine N(5)-oxygenase family protein [Corynebacteriales bacterium]|nr:lysine N(6)-hydroxylase/L-ornithine N(5)-oxygenase family protein [Mycobacteriales bacterium]
MNDDVPYDLVGVGIGPFNLALAALADPIAELSTLFLERKPEFSWHPGLLLPGTQLQVPFLADLVTLVEPRSPWSFLAYLQAQDRLFPFYFSERFHVARREYDHYCRWVAESLPTCQFGSDVTSVAWDDTDELFEVTYERGDIVREIRARNVVLGVGTEPALPHALAAFDNPAICHSAQYSYHRAELFSARDVTVIGSGQSSAEIFLDLLRHQSDDQQLRWLTRSAAFAPMEYSKLGLEHFTPDYTRYFYSLNQDTKDVMLPSQGQLYKGISADTISEIFDELYEKSVGNAQVSATIAPNVEVEAATTGGPGVILNCRHLQLDQRFAVETERVVAGTGYRARIPACVEPLSDFIQYDHAGRFQIDENYRVKAKTELPGSALFIQNGELHSHGVGAPDLGLGAWRAATILNALTGDDPCYRLPQRTAFTTFGVPVAH